MTVGSEADWLVVAGFLFASMGLALRAVMMMRASDALPAGAAAKGGRELLRSYRHTFPKSRLPIAMWVSLAIGLIMLVAGLLLEFR
jgi:hypothetical protein